MAVSFDTSGVHDSGSTGVATLSNNFTIGASLTNGAIVGFIAVFGTQITSPTMTWNSVSMTQVGSTTIFDAGAGTITLFALVNPTGGTHSLSASWTTSGPAAIGFWTFAGVDQTGGATTFKNGTTNNNGGNTSTKTNTVTTTNGNGTVGGWLAGQNFSGTQTPTQDWQDLPAGGAITEGQHVLSSGASASYTATLGAADFMLFCGCDILAAAGGVTFIPPSVFDDGMPWTQLVEYIGY